MAQVEMVGIAKHFGGVKALRNVSFAAEAGEIHALMGENGAGKSTLMKTLSGAYLRDAGEIKLKGQVTDIQSPRQALDMGVTVIYQELVIAPHLSVAENIFIDHLSTGGFFVKRSHIEAEARKVLAEIGFTDIDVSRPAGELSIAYQQVVEICKALTRNSSVLVLDEPTAVLTSHETEKLFELLFQLRDKGVCIIYVSHRLEEIFHICTRATILKDGETVGTVNIADITQHDLINMMVGRELSDLFPDRSVEIGAPVLEVEGLNAGVMVQDVGFTLYAGEVLGFAGLVGAGRTETMRAIFGADARESGRIVLKGREISPSSPKEAIRDGIGLLPEDRKAQGVLLEMSVRVNGALRPDSPYESKVGLIDRAAEGRGIQALVEQLAVKTASIESNVGDLSGGNQQKVALMKWVDMGSDVLIVDEPTRGVDVGAKIEIYNVINDLAAKGVGVIVVSSEMTELIGVCDRVLVMREGHIAGELTGDDIREDKMIALAMGLN
ncbi:sugar ABC transporter ATP-binding protein [Pacificoceanicola onchidii]|uniref:sugar ABC transporter ATP-binding protein n=1 Tax=Pacificoceanicola onchidii TaxID=2562685 RepID=UPI0010A5EA3A|nr:sugar ABC transporter ATP-binding protein [Pacificoceanicola onchidii]